MFTIEDKFGINREEKFTELGNKICLICTSFEPRDTKIGLKLILKTFSEITKTKSFTNQLQNVENT